MSERLFRALRAKYETASDAMRARTFLGVKTGKAISHREKCAP
jgi:hypothetical protein